MEAMGNTTYNNILTDQRFDKEFYIKTIVFLVITKPILLCLQPQLINLIFLIAAAKSLSTDVSYS
jgi:hypothetical protein